MTLDNARLNRLREMAAARKQLEEMEQIQARLRALEEEELVHKQAAKKDVEDVEERIKQQKNAFTAEIGSLDEFFRRQEEIIAQKERDRVNLQRENKVAMDQLERELKRKRKAAADFDEVGEDNDDREASPAVVVAPKSKKQKVAPPSPKEEEKHSAHEVIPPEAPIVPKPKRQRLSSSSSAEPKEGEKQSAFEIVPDEVASFMDEVHKNRREELQGFINLRKPAKAKRSREASREKSREKTPVITYTEQGWDNASNDAFPQKEGFTNLDEILNITHSEVQGVTAVHYLAKTDNFNVDDFLSSALLQDSMAEEGEIM